ncbi:MAG: hypothetical protein ACKVQB_06060 [Bacteroidia bacterium]
MLGCLSTALFFLEPNPLQGNKLDFLIILFSTVWVIYTADHVIDGYRFKGKSGILRYDFNFLYIKIILPICAGITVFAISLILKNKNTTFVTNGLWIAPIIPIYFFLKFKGKLKPLVKMAIISVVVSSVMVSLYNSPTIFYDFLTLERLIIALMVFLNLLVLEHFEYHEEHKQMQPETVDLYLNIAKRVFIWIVIMLILATYQNIASWPFTVSLFLAALFIRIILNYQTLFGRNRRYRYWADFSFLLMWPLLKLFQLFA